MKIEVGVKILNAITENVRAILDEPDLETVDIHVTRIVRLLEGIENAHPGCGLHRRLNRRKKEGNAKR
jgi:hypothetical protein